MYTHAEQAAKVKEIFHAALEMERRDLAAFIEGACAGDMSLLREVESLLASHYQDDTSLESPAFAMSASDLARQVLDEQEEMATGRRIGNYRLLREIGRGGMSVVYLAMRDDDQYQKQVAIKLLKRGMDTDAIIRHFRKERQLLANFDHPNIARLIDGGVAEDGLPYFVMEYVEGRPIDAYADEHKLSIVERLRMFRIVCEAVQYAHRNKVIHRDIKPRNILVNEERVPKLLDFGIAKIMEPDSSANTTETTTAAFRVMTPEYASPEQMRGETVTPASDVYSLGVLLYELLVGHGPYRFGSKSPYEIFRVVSEEEPEPPSKAIAWIEPTASKEDEPQPGLSPEAVGKARDTDPKRLRRLLSGDLDNIVLTALNKEPRIRYASAREFSDDIRRHLEGLPIVARKGKFRQRTAKFLRRHRAYAMTMIGIALLSILVGIYVGMFRTNIGHRESVAVLPLVNASQDENTDFLAAGITDSLIDKLARLRGLSVSSARSSFPYRGQAKDSQTIARELGAETILSGSVSSVGDNLSIKIELIDTASNQLIWTKRYSGKSSGILIMQQELASDVAHQFNLQLSDEEQQKAQRRYSANSEAYGLYLKGYYLWSQRTLLSIKQGKEYFQQAIEKDPNYALAYTGLANSYFLLSVWGSLPAIEAFPAARAAAQKALELDPNLAEAHTSLAIVKWLYEWDWEGADREFKRAIELNPRYVTAPHWYGLYLGEMGRFEEAIATEKRALELEPLSPPVNADYGRVLYYARRYKESLDQYQKTIRMNPNFDVFYAELSMIYEQLGMQDEWYSTMDKISGFDVPATRQGYREHGMMGYRRALLDAFKNTAFLRWNWQYNKAELHAQLGEKDQAFEALNAAYEVRDHRMAQLKVNPKFDNLRSDPRFIDLIRRMKFTS